MPKLFKKKVNKKKRGAIESLILYSIVAVLCGHAFLLAPPDGTVEEAQGEESENVPEAEGEVERPPKEKMD